tara:strand:- start:394 stop:1077 length:684 start_codon:yes stop_codon:yes gene_type:complete
MAFPTSPSNNQVHQEGNRAWVYDSGIGAWDQVAQSDYYDGQIQSSGEISSNVQFPKGHVLQTFYAEDDGGQFVISDPSHANSVYSELDVTISDGKPGNSIVVILFLSAIYNNGNYGNSLYTGVRYSTDGWSDPDTGYDLKTNRDEANSFRLMRSCYMASGSTSFNMMTSDTLVFRANHPTLPTGVIPTYRIRPCLVNSGSGMTINTTNGRSTMTVFEIQGPSGYTND